MTMQDQRARMRVQPRSGNPRFRVENRAGSSEAQIHLYDEIGPWGVSAAMFAQALGEVKAASKVTLFINSPGGDVFDGFSMLEQLRRFDGDVEVVVDGLAASAASLVAMGGATIVMSRSAQMMIHDPFSVVVGNVADLRGAADALEKLATTVADVYAERAGGESASWRAAMLAETWYTAQEAVAAGLATKVDGADGEDPEVSNRFDLSIFAHAGRSHARNPLPAADGFSNHQSPATEPETTTQKGDVVSDAFMNEMARMLGIADVDGLDEQKLLDGVREALDEQSTDGASTATTPEVDPAPAGETPAVVETPAAPAQAETIGGPANAGTVEGTITIDKAAFEQLQADAAAGREAKERLDRDQREQVVNSAVAAGKIAPKAKAEWLERINKPGNAETITEVINALPTVFNVADAGFTGGVEQHNDNDTDQLAVMAGWDTPKGAN